MTVYNQRLSRYVSDLFAVHDQALELALQDASQKGLPVINITPEEGRFLQFLARACGAKRAVELGTLGGYSGIWIARGLVEGGRLVSIEREPHRAQVAREHFSAAGLADRVEVRVGDALQMLDSLSTDGPFDFVFIDADKAGYPLYFDWAVGNTRVGALIAAHNAFRYGQVVQAGRADESTRVIHALNQRVAKDPRLISTIYPGGDGTLVAVKIS